MPVFSGACLLAIAFGAAYCFNNEAMVSILSVCVLIPFLFLSETNTLYLLFFWFPFFTVLQVGGTYYYPYLLFILLIKSVIIHRKKVRIDLILTIICIAVLELMGFVQCGHYPFAELAKLLTAIVFAGHYLTKQPADYDHNTALRFFFAGMLIECITNIIAMGSLVGSTTYYGLSVDRQAVLNQDANSGAMFCITALWFCISVLAKSKRKIFLTVLFFCIAVCGLFSQSKVYLFLMLPTMLVFLWTCRKSLFALVCIAFTVIVLIIVYLSNDVFQSIVISYALRFQRIDGLESLTTGRNIGYIEYLERIFTHIRTMFIGDGILSEQHWFLAREIGVGSSGLNLRPHNILLELLAGWGVLGSTIFIRFWRRSYQSVTIGRIKGEPIAKKLLRLAPLIVFLLFSMTINVAYQPISYILFLMCLYHAKNDLSEVSKGEN